MQFVNIHDAKTHLSKYLEQVEQTHEAFVICRNGKPIAKLVEYQPTASRQLGTLKGKIQIADDFDALPEAFMGHFK